MSKNMFYPVKFCPVFSFASFPTKYVMKFLFWDLCNMSSFSSNLFINCVSIITFGEFNHNVPYCSVLHLSSSWSLLSFLNLSVYSFHDIWIQISGIISSIFFWSYPLSSFGAACLAGCFQLPHSSKIFCSCF